MNQTIYFQKVVWDDLGFSKEPHKSELINQLLKKHYGINKLIDNTVHKSSQLLNDEKANKVSKLMDKRSTRPADTARRVFSDGVVFTCDNGHIIPEGRDRCLGKGCKYS